MRYLLTLTMLYFAANTYAQQTPLPHGMVFGTKPDTAVVLDAAKLERFMGRKNRISTVIKGEIVKVSLEKGGWFELEAGEGKIISARFKDHDIKLPSELKGRTVIIQGIANRKLKAINGKPTGRVVVEVKNPEQSSAGTAEMIFEVTGIDSVSIRDITALVFKWAIYLTSRGLHKFLKNLPLIFYMLFITCNPLVIKSNEVKAPRR